ncbi:MAG: PilC/PilY family type IV pilus protein, partial [Gammaproteobacteria bacterium]|nr:PilC/PilY family type IV pilus protein [Gammaproteobacteria bacterium]
EAREWLMADALHSRPLPLNYGSRGVGYSANNPAIYIAVGSNDGYMRFLRNTTGTSGESGEEVWAFMPQSVMDKVKIHRNNAAGVTHPYMVDGAPVAYLEDMNGNGTIDIGEKAYLIFGLRRGGKSIYALDVSDPENPELLWKKDNNDAGFAELGYTFSTPRIISTEEGGSLRPALAFAGGYDLNKDDRSGVGTDDDEGNAIFVVDLETGDLIWKAAGPGPFSGGLGGTAQFYHADLVDSIPSTVAALDSDGNFITDRLYVGDTGGNLWRADINGTDKSNWKLTLFARLGRHALATPDKANDRRFFHRPDVIQTFESNNVGFDAVVLGSGDRPDPLDKAGLVANWSYMVKDGATAPGAGVDRTTTYANLGNITNTCFSSSTPCEADLTDGWRLQLENTGEKQLSSPVTIANTVYFTTYVPDEGITQCGPKEGGGRLYAVGLKSGWAINNYDVTTEELERSTKLKSAGIPAEVVSIPKNFILRPDGDFEDTGTSTRIETYWFEEEDGDL